MSKKVLKGFYEKDATIYTCLISKKILEYWIKKDNLVSVRLASESVDLKALKEYCVKNSTKTMAKAMKRFERRNKLKGIEQQTNDRLEAWESGKHLALCNLLSWAEKEAKK